MKKWFWVLPVLFVAAVVISQDATAPTATVEDKGSTL